MNNDLGLMEPKDIRDIISILTEHNRKPGQFVYNYPQEFYSTFPEITREAYMTLGNAQATRKVLN